MACCESPHSCHHKRDSLSLTGQKHQTERDIRVYNNTFVFLLPTTHIYGQICILLHTWKVIRCVEKLEWVLSEGADHHTTVDRALQDWDLPAGEAHTKILEQKQQVVIQNMEYFLSIKLFSKMCKKNI